MNIDLLLSFLKNTLNGPISISLLADETRTSKTVIRQTILHLAQSGFITNMEGDEFSIIGNERLNLAVLAIREGADVERVSKVLGWSEFEDLVALILEQHGFNVKKHFRLKASGKRYEIDVIGLKEPFALSVECKHWKRSWRRAATIEVINVQRERTKALIQSIPEPKDRLKISKWREVKVIPLILTLSDTPLKLYEGTAVVPIFHFNSFLNEMQHYMDELIILSSAKLVKQDVLNM